MLATIARSLSQKWLHYLKRVTEKHYRKREMLHHVMYDTNDVAFAVARIVRVNCSGAYLIFHHHYQRANQLTIHHFPGQFVR